MGWEPRFRGLSTPPVITFSSPIGLILASLHPWVLELVLSPRMYADLLS